ncbi:helix-turn-helix domain-containing protein [Nonomuraea basaltis]|uniref:helix-turn-helix domain-containing protein n=1 Tax=Nonomuraea basaltis TaxID=2495887 RepID=UPI00110C4F9B|nr:helix-turn-helix domain-containing protein [Nonomuraea basaltis]TMR89284.1 helix-turn-helix transcriptional regulator [Nonomuraea basaltis]
MPLRTQGRDPARRAAGLRKKGYEGATLDEIAAADVTKAALYGYFRSKEELFGALITQVEQMTTAGVEG